MTTATALEGITDTGQFEILALRVLRVVESDCRSLEGLGVNADGKPIRGRLDAFAQLPGSDPPLFVMAAFTTTESKALRGKWLADSETPADEGDLVKAAGAAAELRRVHPTARFAVYLCTNRGLDEGLMRAAIEYGRMRGIEVRFLAQSRIRDFLDMTPIGHWLRKEHLGIAAELVSEPLLHRLSAESLARYREYCMLPSPDVLVETQTLRRAESDVDQRAASAHVISGPSGAGKSTVAFQLLHRHVAKGGIGFWISGEVVARATSLEAALDDALHEMQPSLEGGAGSAALRFGRADTPVMVVVDDVRRGGRPLEGIAKALAWREIRRADAGRANVAPGPARIIVVPAWESDWLSLSWTNTRRQGVATTTIDWMSKAESEATVERLLRARGASVSPERRRTLAAALGRDPILLRLFSELPMEADAVPVDDAADVMRRYANDVIDTARHGSGTTRGEYEEALLGLAADMLAHRELSPLWTDVVSRLSRDQIAALRALLREPKIGRIQTSARGERFVFRHDRIGEHFLARAVEPMLPNPGAHADVLSDPYFAYVVGRALAGRQDDPALLAWMREHAPLALAFAIRLLDPGATGSVDVATELRTALAEAFEGGASHGSLLWTIANTLRDTDSPLVLAATDGLPWDFGLMRARYANGDADAAVQEFAMRGEFPPSMGDAQRDDVLRRALGSHAAKVTDRCRAILQSSGNADELRGALTLAGFIGDPTLGSAVGSAWIRSAEKDSILVTALWAALRCWDGDAAARVEAMCNTWATLADEHNNAQMSDRSYVSDALRFAVKRGIPGGAVEFLVARARLDSELEHQIAWLLEHIDHPAAVRFLVERAGAISRRATESGGMSYFLLTLPDNWDPDMHGRGRRLPPECLDALRAAWEADGADPFVRGEALRCWLRATDDVETLRAIPKTARDYDEVLWRRVRLGDQTTVPEVKARLKPGSSWLRIIDHAWSREYVSEVDAALGSLRRRTAAAGPSETSQADHDLSDLLRDIPVEDAEPLLLAHWEHLRVSPRFIQCALYLGTPKTLELAAQAIAGSPPSDVFRFVSFFFGFKTVGLRDRLTKRHLEALRPYLSRLDPMVLSDMASFCDEHNLREWGRANVAPEVQRLRREATSSEERKRLDHEARRHHPTEDDLLAELDEMYDQRSQLGHLSYWCERFAQRGDPEGRCASVVLRWLARDPSSERFCYAAEAILQIGTRTDLEALKALQPAGASAAAAATDASFAVRHRSLS